VKRDWALGESTRKVWEEIWPDVGPRAESVYKTAQATWDEGLLLFLERSGYPEETYHTFSYSPVPHEDGSVGGILCVVTEDTDRIIGERRLSLLRDLAADLSGTNSETELFSIAARRLATNAKDLPFALIYLFSPDGKGASLVCSEGVEAGDPVAPDQIDLESANPIWPVKDIFDQKQTLVIHDLDLPGQLPTGPWDKPSRQAVVAGIAQQGQSQPVGFLVAAINPYRPFDATYGGFVELLAGQISAGLSNIRAYEAERKRAEALAEIDRAKTTFFSNVSHELRTPLTLMLGPIDDLLQELYHPTDSGKIELATLARRNGLRLLRLVNNLLDFSRLEANRVQASYEPTDLALLTTDLASSFRSAIEKSGLRFVVECPLLKEPVHVDREMWEKIVLNLLSNAFKFTLHGKIRIALRDMKDAVELTVEDTGSGIPEAARPHVFERFYRVPGAAGRTHEGTGIGLALVRELARLHGGNVRVESEMGKGSTFTVAIRRGTAHLPENQISSARGSSTAGLGKPFVEEASQWSPEENITFHPAINNAAPAAPAGSTSLSRILVADDNADMRSYIARLLSQNFRVTAVADGWAALESAQREAPDLILSDVMMPRLDGFGFLKAIREDPKLKTTPVILLSARAGEEARVEGVLSGADDYLIKPFSGRELLARISAHLELARVRREAAIRVRESEDRFRILGDHAPALIWMADTTKAFTWFNKPWLDFVGRPMEKEVGNGWLENVHPDNVQRCFEIYCTTFDTRKPFTMEYRMRRHDGQYRWIMNNGVPLRNSAGEFTGYIGSCIDITDRKLTEETLEIRVADRTTSLREAITQMEEFSYSVSHDLRAPVRAIQGYAQAVLEDFAGQVDGRGKLFLERIVHNSTRMDRLIQDVLTCSRLTRREIPLGPVSLENLLHEILHQYPEMQPPQADVVIHGSLLSVTGHEPSLSQAVSNLLNNAVKFMVPHTTPHIEIWTEARGNEVRLWIQDNGIGIKPEYQGRLFGMFERVHPEKAYEGTGIGLAIVRKSVERMGGKAGVESDGSNGSKFWIQLPAANPL
jgi:PAS domain S-box-containing protein